VLSLVAALAFCSLALPDSEVYALKGSFTGSVDPEKLDTRWLS
jgi:hypothetical protein